MYIHLHNAVQQVKINIIGIQLFQLRLKGGLYVLHRPAALRRMQSRKLGGDEVCISRVDAQRLADDALAQSAAVHIGGVEVVHAVLVRVADQRDRLILVDGAAGIDRNDGGQAHADHTRLGNPFAAQFTIDDGSNSFHILWECIQRSIWNRLHVNRLKQNYRKLS